MKIGVNLINFGPGASPDALLSWARLVEDLERAEDPKLHGLLPLAPL